MSWSVGSAGKVPAVTEQIEKQFMAMTHPCPEPEESAKQLVRQAIAKLLEGHTKPSTIVKVSASGSQSWGANNDGFLKDVYNSLNVSMETIQIVE